MKKNTRAISTPYPRGDAYGALSMPVYHCAAYEFPDADTMADSFCGRSSDPDYSRVTNPTVIHYENIVKSLTGARDVVAFNSGMAAISAVAMALTGAGKKIVTSRHLFGNTYLLFTSTLARFGVKTDLIDLTDLKAVEMAVDADTAMVYLETVTNPQMEIADVAAISAIARRHGVPVVADTTMIPFIYTDSRALGIDVEILSSTKYLSGGATSLGGLVIDYGTVRDFDCILRKDMLMNLGGYLNPHAAYMQTLGLETLDARYAAQERNALEVARSLDSLAKETPGVEVCYPGLPDNRWHEACARQYGGRFGAMLTLTLPDYAACMRFINALKLVRRATNLFDNRSLAIHPASTIFGTMTPELRASLDVPENLIRLSIGLEDAEDVAADLRQAIAAALKTEESVK
ncbi:MAG: PLP-dependent aspartate aminotransferase family protein [Muribaculaceae bacterium]|nr:PLP-dependent aspartate aminotransferase family protein [Muribaculaceae bacterium]